MRKRIRIGICYFILYVNYFLLSNVVERAFYESFFNRVLCFFYVVVGGGLVFWSRDV